MESLHNLIFPVYEIGSITLDEYLDTVVFNHPRNFTREDFKSFIFSESKELPELLQWLIAWKKICDFRIISINNEGKELNDYRIKKFGLHRCFDAFVSSCEVGMRKPDPSIFKLAMGIAQAEPQQCYYFDDRPMLVEAARRTGINVFQHIDFESTKQIIENIQTQPYIKNMPDNKYTFGMIGLGTMGRNLLLNMADHNFLGAGYDKDTSKLTLLEQEGEGKPVKGFATLPEFIGSLQKPRALMMLVPAGKIVDSVIEDLIPLMEEGDIIIDGGNSHFTDTNRRVAYLQTKKLHFFGMGISGGEEGARRGPSMMPGGDKEAYSHVKNIFDAIAAQVENEPCVTYIGPGASGHFVKMVHNGIEYGLMQLIAETYGLLKNGLQLEDQAIQQIFEKWNQGKLKSYLLDITKDIFNFKNEGSNDLLLNSIKDEARAKGTGKWTSQIAMDLETPVPTIDTAVSMRDLSKYKDLRVKLSELYPEKLSLPAENKDEFVNQMEQALYFNMIMTYTQGMHLLFKASKAYNYNLNLAAIASIWRGGCIIRSEFLNVITKAYHSNDNMELLLTDETVQGLIKEAESGIRTVLTAAIQAGIAVPAYASCLSYYDTFRTKNLPSNLIQAQRDYFGAHTYELIGKEGFFHTEWQAIPSHKTNN